MTNPPPRPLEVLVAERVLGWEVGFDAGLWWYLGGIGEPRRVDLLSKLRSWSGLGLVVEAMEAKGWTVLISRENGDWVVEFEAEDPAAFTGSLPTLFNYGSPPGMDAPWTAAFLAALPAPLSSALARAAAAGETTALLPMEDPPPSEYVFQKFDSIGWALYRVSVGVVSAWHRPPLTPGEAVRIPAENYCSATCGDSRQVPGYGPVCRTLEHHEGETLGPQPSPLNLRVLSVTPERGCETCKGRLSVPCDGPEPGESAVETCPTCHGEPPWRWWRVGFERVNENRREAAKIEETG